MYRACYDFGQTMKTNAEWKAWGDLDPLFGVASWQGRRRTDKTPWTDNEFYALGADWLDFERTWQANIGFRPGEVLEIGCGAGRMTQMLARTFANVTAADVAPGMIAYAISHVTAQNIRWEVTDGESLPAHADSMDAVFSCHVFQHFPNNAAQLHTFGDIFRVLKPGGSFYIHLPVHEYPEVNRSFRSFARMTYRWFVRLQSGKAAIMRRIGPLLGKPYMHGVSYEMRPLFRDLRNLGFEQVGMTVVQLKHGPHSCVFGRKPDRSIESGTAKPAAS